MVKYSFEIKKKVVEEYMSGNGGKRYLANKYGVKSPADITKRVNPYKSFGDEGLMRSRTKNSYTFQFKLSVVELYLTTEMSYQDLVLSVGINNPPLIAKWVNDYSIASPDALREKNKERKPTMTKHKNIDKSEENLAYSKQLKMRCRIGLMK